MAIGPLTVYVSKANIPKEYELDDQAQPHWAYKSAEDDSTITVDTMLRLKLLNVRVELTEMVEPPPSVPWSCSLSTRVIGLTTICSCSMLSAPSTRTFWGSSTKARVLVGAIK